MKPLVVLLTIAFSAASLCAAEIKGTVKSVAGDSISVAIEGDVMPPIGAKAEIFFKLAGSDDEISVATGSALKIDHGDLRVKIDTATGSVEQGQLVRFSSSPSSTPAPLSPGTTPAPRQTESPPVQKMGWCVITGASPTKGWVKIKAPLKALLRRSRRTLPS